MLFARPFSSARSSSRVGRRCTLSSSLVSSSPWSSSRRWNGHSIDPRALIEAFAETFRKLEEENRAKSEETKSWLDAGRDRLAGKPPEDEV